jgi:tetratricopeptide (TPR) repeat protein
MMDLQDFNGEMLYFDEPEPPRVAELLLAASQHYGLGDAEKFLLEAYALAPQNLTVLVGMYRFYYYQHRYADANNIAHAAMSAVATKIDFPADWCELDMNKLGGGVLKSMGLVRFYLLALKGAGYLNLRLGNFEMGLRMLRKVRELDEADRLGAKLLLDVLAGHTAEVISIADRRQEMNG